MKPPDKRSGVCICGMPVADHFTKSDRKRSCEDVLRLAVMNAPERTVAGTVSGSFSQLQFSMQTSRLRLVKSDRRSV